MQLIMSCLPGTGAYVEPEVSLQKLVTLSKGPLFNMISKSLSQLLLHSISLLNAISEGRVPDMSTVAQQPQLAKIVSAFQGFIRFKDDDEEVFGLPALREHLDSCKVKNTEKLLTLQDMTICKVYSWLLAPAEKKEVDVMAATLTKEAATQLKNLKAAPAGASGSASNHEAMRAAMAMFDRIGQ